MNMANSQINFSALTACKLLQICESMLHVMQNSEKKINCKIENVSLPKNDPVNILGVEKNPQTRLQKYMIYYFDYSCSN